MTKKQYFLFSLLILLALTGFTQKNVTLSGYVKDAKTGESLLGATVALPELESGTYTNGYGFYSLTVRETDSLVVIFSYLGYADKYLKVAMRSDVSLDIKMEIADVSTDAVVITENKARQNVEKPTMGVIEMSIEQVEMLPYIGGEKDLLKALQLLPGVQGGSEASANFYVRGGQGDQNLILLDEALVYNPFHLGGYMSTFNTDGIRNVTLYKGSFPAQYGGRLSSILDISMKEGNNQKWAAEGGIGSVTSRILVEGPIIKEKMSLMVSARRTYLDLLIRPFLPKGTDVGYFFHDLNGKWNWNISKKDRVYLSGYYGRDKLYTNLFTPTDTTKFGVYWGNKTMTARWNHLYNDKLFSNTTFVYNDYLYNNDFTLQGFSIRLMSGIKDINGKIDFDYFPNLRHKIKFGANYTYHTFTPSSVKFKTSAIDSLDFTNIQQKFVHESAVYINDEYIFNEKLNMNLGFRAPFFVYKKTQYFGLEPRFTLNYILDKNTSIKGSYTMMKQFVTQISSSSISLPFDLWVPATDTVKPQTAHQGAIGLFKNFFEDKYEASFEAYYKYMTNQVDYKEGTNFFFNSNYQGALVFGNGWSYGGEFYLRKRSGRFTGWLSYTLAWSRRQFDDLNDGKPFAFKYDRRHNLSLVAIYNFNKRWSFSSVFVYQTGSALTLPEGRLFVPVYGWTNNYSWYNDYTEKNGYRLKAYNRLDIGLRYKAGKKLRSEIHIDIYNVYNRRNPFFVYMTQERDSRSNGTKFVAKQISLLPVIPSVSYNFSF
ncbi:MAG: TonB-dependent receptor [Bacteroidia bacterium]|nr:TonB-dependent receptor [Bacteroidia bacterium]